MDVSMYRIRETSPHAFFALIFFVGVKLETLQSPDISMVYSQITLSIHVSRNI